MLRKYFFMLYVHMVHEIVQLCTFKQHCSGGKGTLYMSYMGNGTLYMGYMGKGTL